MKKKDRKEQRSDASYSERIRVKWFCCAFKSGFVQLICKASSIFKSNLKLAFFWKKENHMSQRMLWWSIDV